jgi:hypothetical protein
MGQGEAARWTSLGAAWQHIGGEGFIIQLDFMPISAEGRFAAAR